MFSSNARSRRPSIQAATAYLILRFEMSVERAGAQLGTIEDGGDAESSNSLFAQGF
jgi:hypothetical protein